MLGWKQRGGERRTLRRRTRGHSSAWDGSVGEGLAIDPHPGDGGDSDGCLFDSENVAMWDQADPWDNVDELRRLLRLQIPRLGYDHPMVLVMRMEIAIQLGMAERFEEALESSEALLVDRARVFGPCHVATCETRLAIASCHAQLGG